jgi:hypothetical protein
MRPGFGGEGVRRSGSMQKKLRDESRTNFSFSRVLSRQNRMRIAQSPRGGGKGDPTWRTRGRNSSSPDKLIGNPV